MKRLFILFIITILLCNNAAAQILFSGRGCLVTEDNELPQSANIWPLEVSIISDFQKNNIEPADANKLTLRFATKYKTDPSIVCTFTSTRMLERGTLTQEDLTFQGNIPSFYCGELSFEQWRLNALIRIDMVLDSNKKPIYKIKIMGETYIPAARNWKGELLKPLSLSDIFGGIVTLYTNQSPKVYEELSKSMASNKPTLGMNESIGYLAFALYDDFGGSETKFMGHPEAYDNFGQIQYPVRITSTDDMSNYSFVIKGYGFDSQFQATGAAKQEDGGFVCKGILNTRFGEYSATLFIHKTNSRGYILFEDLKLLKPKDKGQDVFATYRETTVIYIGEPHYGAGEYYKE